MLTVGFTLLFTALSSLCAAYVVKAVQFFKARQAETRKLRTPEAGRSPGEPEPPGDELLELELLVRVTSSRGWWVAFQVRSACDSRQKAHCAGVPFAPLAPLRPPSAAPAAARHARTFGGLARAALRRCAAAVVTRRGSRVTRETDAAHTGVRVYAAWPSRWLCCRVQPRHGYIRLPAHAAARALAGPQRRASHFSAPTLQP